MKLHSLNKIDMVQKTIVQYERLRPDQIVARRRECPVAYLPIGTLEWHGVQNPVGLDTLKIHALLCRCADKLVVWSFHHCTTAKIANRH